MSDTSTDSAKTIVIVPTYNERENIQQLVPALVALGRKFDIVVVDDNSPDGTAKVVEELKTRYPNLHLFSREKKAGLGKAYLAGFQWCLGKGYDYLVQMDCDFSHRPVDLLKVLDALPNNDLVIGSRYVPGGGTQNWGFIRKLISRGGSLYSRMILGLKVRDLTGGFNGWRASLLKSIPLDEVQSNGYSFQIEMKYRASRKAARIHEVPILFEDRRVGQSKMSSRIVVEALFRVWKIRGVK